ncbi:hypothetical protein BG003_000258 [Podila horticola]|nr:hypothetical protein BG003_000258 [Podila horticola]
MAAGGFAHLYGLLNVCDYHEVGSDASGVSATPNGLPYCITTVEVDEFSLVAHCVMIRYLISGKLVRHADLSGGRAAAAGSQWAVAELLVDPIKTAPWEEINMLAEQYGLEELKTLCAEHLLTSNNRQWCRLAIFNEQTTIDCDFIFPLSSNDPRGNDTAIAVWCHQSMLAATSHQFIHLHGVTKLANHSLSIRGQFLLCTDEICEFSLVGFCAFLRYIYTGEVERTIDLRQFLFTHWPLDVIQHVSCYIDQVLMADPVQTVSWTELYRLSVSRDDRYIIMHFDSNTSASSNKRRYQAAITAISDPSLVAHCALVQCRYKCQLGEQVDLCECAIHRPAFMHEPQQDVDLLLLWPVRATPWLELLHLAHRYQVTHLEDLCQAKVAASLAYMKAVPVLLELGEVYPELWTKALDLCGHYVLEMY